MASRSAGFAQSWSMAWRTIVAGKAGLTHNLPIVVIKGCWLEQRCIVAKIAGVAGQEVCWRFALGRFAVVAAEAISGKAGLRMVRLCRGQERHRIVAILAV